MLNCSRVCIRRKFAQSMRTPAGNGKDAKAGIGTHAICRDEALRSACGGKPENIWLFEIYRFDPNWTSAVKLTASIERQWRPIFLVTHAGEVISGVNVSCPAEEELLECSGSARP